MYGSAITGAKILENITGGKGRKNGEPQQTKVARWYGVRVVMSRTMAPVKRKLRNPGCIARGVAKTRFCCIQAQIPSTGHTESFSLWGELLRSDSRTSMLPCLRGTTVCMYVLPDHQQNILACARYCDIFILLGYHILLRSRLLLMKLLPDHYQ